MKNRLNMDKYLRLRYALEKLLIIALSPIIIVLFFAIYLYVFLNLKSNVIFKQHRPGINGTIFLLFKFRTMTSDGKVHPRLAFLRKYRLDEIPQFWNILLGDMSLIGPRPEPMDYYHRILVRFPEYSKRYEIKPGLTGFAQVKYKHTQTVDDSIKKFSFDMEYISNINASTDVWICFKTFEVMLSGNGDA